MIFSVMYHVALALARGEVAGRLFCSLVRFLVLY